MRSLNRRLTDIELAKLEERIADLFGEARQELQKTSQDYWDNLIRREEVMMRKFERGELTMEQYQKWYIAQVGRGKNYDTIINNMAKVLTDTNESAVAMTNDAMAGIYSLNRNISNYMIEGLAGDGVDFALWNENAVRNMVLNQPDVMPYYPPQRALDREIDLEYGKRIISRQTTLAIMQGKDINQIANSLMDKITGMERSSATRAARTAVGAAMNAGSLDSYEEAKSLGLKVEKQWEAGIDGRTRDSHIEMNGVRIPVEKKFPNGLMYPCDPYGRPEEVYNCRCCLIPILPETANKVKQEPHTEASYRAWQQEKIDAGKIIDLAWYKQNEFKGYNTGGFVKVEKEPTVIDMQNYAELKDYFETKYDIDFSDAISQNCNFEHVRKACEGIEAMLDKYPQLHQTIDTIGLKNRGYMCSDGSSIFFNPNDFKNAIESEYDKYFAIQAGAHEAAHCLDMILCMDYVTQSYDLSGVKNVVSFLFRNATGEFYSNTVARKIVSSALSSVKKKYPELKSVSNERLRGMISAYAKTDTAETLAESFGNIIAATLSGDDVSRMKIEAEVVRVTEERLSKVTWL